MTITPILAMIGKRVARSMNEPEPSQVTEEDAQTRRAIVVGFGRVGRLVSDMLAKHGQPYIAVDSDTDLVSKGRRKGYTVTFGDAAAGNALTRLNRGK